MAESKIDLLNKYLKSRFFGIDRVIDEICDKIKAWYFVPESMIRPQVINLWGMTGVGKTQIVRDIAEFLAKDLIQIDLGEYVGDSTKNLGYNFFEKYYGCSQKPVIILIDEFHIARTKDQNGAEVDRKGIRSLWHLLSDGLLYIDESHMSESIDWSAYLIESAMDDYQSTLKYFSTHKHVEPKNGDEDSKIIATKAENDLEYNKKRLTQTHKFFPRHLLGMVSRALGYNSSKELIKSLDDNFIQACNSIQDRLENMNVQPKLDFTKALIFISGNLDQLYTGSDNFDPDVDLEILEAKAEEITVSDVKKDLTSRFRLEQIGRLGNNHIIYPVLNKESYYKIIQKDLNRLKQFYLEKQRLNLNFQDSAVEIVYKEGVFPNQGARSVLSTVGTLIESALANFYLAYKQMDEKVKDVQISFGLKEFIFKFGTETVTIPALLKIDELRKPVVNQRSVISAVHEAGHIVVSVLRLGIIPSRASVFVATSETSGIVEVLTIESKKSCETFATKKNYITVALAGSVSEKVVYGQKEASCGSYSDLKKATESAIDLISNYGYVDMITRTRNQEHFPVAVFRTVDHEKLMLDILKECEKDAKNLIKGNIPFLKSLSDCLLSKTTVYKNDITKVMENHGVKCAIMKDYIKTYRQLPTHNFHEML